MRTSRALLTALVATLAVWAQASETVSHPFVGVTRTVRTETAPRPLRMHIVDIDLDASGIRFRLTPHSGPLHTRKQTTLDYLRQQHAQVATNAHFFEPWPAPNPDPGTASLVGIAASDGQVYAPFLDKPPKQYAICPNAPGLNIDAGNHACIVHRNVAEPSGYIVAESITLLEAAKLLPNKPSACTLWRWCVWGVHNRVSDEVVRLRFVCIGRRYFTAAEWLDEFIDNVTAARIAGHRQKYGDKPDARWNRIRELAQADEVLRRARI